MLHEDLLWQAYHHPKATAIVEIDERGETCRRSFAELRSFALGIRRTLSPLLVRGSGTTTAHHVGILAEGGGLALYAAWLAVLWEGCTVVPLSAGAPVDRLSSILADATVTVVLLTDHQSSTAAGAICQAMNMRCRNVSMLDVQRRLAAPPDDGSRFCRNESNLTMDASEKENEPATAAAFAASDGDAYLYYTSGSSGEPKGVHSGHAPMMNRLRWMWEQWPFAEDEVCCQRVDHVFIDFVAEVFGPLSRGVPILVVPDAVRRNPVSLGNFISENGVTRITLVPTLARLIAEAATMASTATGTKVYNRGTANTPAESLRCATMIPSTVFKSVRLWILSGEALPWAVARDLARLSTPSSVLLNLYGSTEMAADITAHSLTCKDALLSQAGGKIDSENGAQGTPSVSIGLPIANCGVELMEVVEPSEGPGAHGSFNDGPPNSLHRIDPRNHGRIGMIYVWGAGLARGYWGRPTATETNFPSYVWESAASCYRLCSGKELLVSNAVRNREADDGGGSHENGCRDGRTIRFFRTGDLASFEKRQDGESSSLVYRGRLDQQIKLNGRRLDLAEVEACMVQASGVALGSAVALTSHDASDEDVGGPQGSGLASSSIVGALVSPKTVDTAIVLTMCERLLPSFAVPKVVVTTSAMPTLPGSGKVDRRAVRRMLVEHIRHQRGSVDSTDNNDATASSWIRRVENTTRIITEAVACMLQTSDRRQDHVKRAEINDGSDLFSEVGLSSVQAVHLVHELRQRIPAVPVSLTDLYSHPGARSLAQWLLRAADTAVGETKEGERDFVHEAAPGVSLSGGSLVSSNGEGADVVTSEAFGNSRDDRVRFFIRPMTTDRKAETYAMFTDVFLNSEPLMSSRFRTCRAKAGPFGAAVVRRCYNRLVIRSIDWLEERGGRVLIATDDTTGQVLGVTIGTELVQAAPGSGFLAGSAARAEDLAEDAASAQGVSTDVYQAEETAWQRLTGWLLEIPLKHVMRPISALIGELLRIYREERGWAYEPGEVMYISETGCRSARLDGAEGKSKDVFDRAGRGAGESTGSSGADGSRGGIGGGVQAALLAESLERQLLREASAAGFLRAVTICTNAVTAHVARELGFREVTRISPVQTYHPSDQQATANPLRLTLPRMSRHRFLPLRRHAGNARRGKDVPRPGPFASVGQEHADIILFEKIIVPSVPRELLLSHRKQDLRARSESSVAVPAESSFAANTIEKYPKFISSHAVAVGERWRLVRVGQGSWEHHCEMLAVLADGLPGLASTGEATRFMADDEKQGQAAFLLLTAPATAGRPEMVASVMATRVQTGGKPQAADSNASPHGDSVASSPPNWTVAACMSWRRQNTSLSGTAALLVSAGNTVSAEGSYSQEGKLSSTQPQKPWRELLVLAVGRRWRYRGLGTALVARLLADSRDVGDSVVYVRSLPESVGFYERHGFRALDCVEGGREKSGRETSLSCLEGECLLVHDFTFAETRSSVPR